MANENKDRLGDKLRDLERGREEDYFARRDRELLEKIKRQEAERRDEEKKEGER